MGQITRPELKINPPLEIRPKMGHGYPNHEEPAMFQTFENPSDPSQGPARLAQLRDALAAQKLDGFLVPRADRFQGEYVADCDARLAWLTGFTGSAGFAIILPEIAGVFIDGRYRAQVRDQVDLASFTPVPWPEIKPGPWIAEHVTGPATIGFDPWLHTKTEIGAIAADLAGTEISLQPTANLIDPIWQDRPPAPTAAIFTQPLEFAGQSHADKCTKLAKALREAGQDLAVITQPDSVAWLLNIRGADIARNPVPHAMACLDGTGHVTLFTEPQKCAEIRDHLGTGVTVMPEANLASFLTDLRQQKIRIDAGTAPLELARLLEPTDNEIIWQSDICALPKARKNPVEVAGAMAAHDRDATAMIAFLAWLDATPKSGLTEIDVVKKLEEFRSETNALREISFETISGTGPHGAIIHYRVSEETNREITPGELLLVDSGGQYVDGTTDITRTIATGPVGAAERDSFTRVLAGMIALSQMRWPKGLAGRDLDGFARAALWRAGQDYNHGTGHGVGSYLSVHEGPQRISRASDIPLETGMILSNEPGYYREGAFGIRIENLVVVEPAGAIPGGDPEREFMQFKTLTRVPIDQRLINPHLLSQDARDWLNAYHQDIWTSFNDKISATARNWLQVACEPLVV